MDYRKCTAEELAVDQKFQKWVLDPDPETTDFWKRWLNENPEHQAKANSAIELIHAVGLSKDLDLNASYLAVWKNLHDNTRLVRTEKRSEFRYAKIAAVFIGLAIASFILWNLLGNENTLEYRTAYGETKDVVLEDGSRVKLNSNTVLTLKKNWSSENSREVTLEGEAFFEVVKTTDKKSFQVNTEDEVSIKVLGTEFNVNTRRQHVEVFLQSGSVKINSLGGEAILKPGDFMVYQKDSKLLVVKEKELEQTPDLVGWKSNYFLFNDTPMSEIISTLEDDYGFTVTIDDESIGQQKMTAKVSRKNVDILLKVISETLNIGIEQKGKQLTFSKHK